MVMQRVHEARQFALFCAVPEPVSAGALPVPPGGRASSRELAPRWDAAPAQLEPQLVARANLDGELAIDLDLTRGDARHAGSRSERRGDRG